MALFVLAEITNPSADGWQWFNIVIGAISFGLTIWSAIAATSARKAAREAKLAAIRMADHYSMIDLRSQIDDLQKMVIGAATFELIAARSDRVRSSARELRAKLLEEPQVVQFLDVIIKSLELVSEAARNTKTKPETKVRGISQSLGDAISWSGDVIGHDRRRFSR